MQTNEKSLYERIGGHEAVEASVTVFHRKIFADPVLSPFFETTNLPELNKKLVEHLSYLLGGPDEYHGKPLREAHKHLFLNENHFSAIIYNLSETLNELNVPPILINEFIQIISRTKADILNE